MITNAIMNNSPVRSIEAKVELYNGSTLVTTYTHRDALVSVTIDRVGDESKFFGFGVCQKINIKLRDVSRQINITTANSFKLYFKSKEQSDYISNYPIFHVTEAHRDENTNQLSITAYDKLDKAKTHTVAELNLTSYTVKEFAKACAALLGASGVEVIGVDNTETCFNTYYEMGANFEGTESIKSALDAIAEVTQTIYYLNSNNTLVFKRLDVSGQSVTTIDKSNYIKLENKTNRRLTSVCHITELGNNIEGTPNKRVTGEVVRLEDVSPEANNVEVRLTSKNLIYYPYYNVSGTISGITYTVNTDGSITANGTATDDSFFYLVQSYKIPAGTYTLSSINITANRELRAAIYNTDNTLDRYIYNETFTIDSEKLVYIYLVIINGNTVSNITYKPILELGSTATNYTPYIGDFSQVTLTESYSGQTYTPEANGTVSGVSVASPTTTLYTDAAAIIHAKYYIDSDISGTTQYVRNNPFWDLRNDIADLVDNALAAVYKMTINQFDCSWRGNYLLEIGDKLAFITKDDNTFISYLLNDSITYNGGLTEKTSWNYSGSEAETAANPSTLGDTLKQTYARVDKVNKEIELVASETSSNQEAISSLQINAESIAASVQQVETNTDEAVANINNSLNTLTTRVDASMTSEDVTIAIRSELENGVDKVITSTGFTFNDEGLTVEKTNSEIKTQITENGMTVYKNNAAVLVANNKGVQAVDLEASTYLIVGKNSRFENYGSNRTGCFWIGG